MQQSNATAQTAAQNMFNGQIAGITSLASGDTTVTITITNPTGNPLVRNVTVAYTAQNENIFASVLGEPTFSLAGSSTASASIAANINFYLLLDNSPSMALPATQAGITEMENLTPQQDGGCAFACHQAKHRTTAITGRANPTVAPRPAEGLHLHDPDAHQLHGEAAAIRTARRRRERRSTTTRWRATTASSCASTPSTRASAI